MLQVVDVEIIANALFKSLLLNIQHSEKEIVLSILDFIKKNNLTIFDHFDKKIDSKLNNNCIKVIDKQQDINNDILNNINNKIRDLYSYINDNIVIQLQKIKDEFLSCLNFLKENKINLKKHKKRVFGSNTKCCGYNRTRNKGPCKKIIHKNKISCKYHEKYVNKNVDNINEGKYDCNYSYICSNNNKKKKVDNFDVNKGYLEKSKNISLNNDLIKNIKINKNLNNYEKNENEDSIEESDYEDEFDNNYCIKCGNYIPIDGIDKCKGCF